MGRFWQEETDPVRLRQLAYELQQDGLLTMAREYLRRAEWLERRERRAEISAE